MTPNGKAVESWRLWRNGGGVPTLLTVEVWEEQPHGSIGKLSKSWTVWVWDHLVPHWDQVISIQGVNWYSDHSTLSAARQRAQAYVVTMGGTRWNNEHVISCDGGALSKTETDRWVRCPVDPPPPWKLRWPGPQPWCDQLLTRSGSDPVD